MTVIECHFRKKNLENTNIRIKLFITVIVMWLQRYMTNKYICYNKMIVYGDSDGDLKKEIKKNKIELLE